MCGKLISLVVEVLNNIYSITEHYQFIYAIETI